MTGPHDEHATTGPRGAGGRGRELWTWVGLTALGCALVLFAATRAWITVRAGHPAGVPGGVGADPAAPTGGELAPVLTPLALAGLAAWWRRWPRRGSPAAWWGRC